MFCPIILSDIDKQRAMMEFQFLGTSAGTPTRARNVTGLALRTGAKSWVLVD